MKLSGDVRISKRPALDLETLLLVVMDTIAEAMQPGHRIVAWLSLTRHPDILEISLSGGDNVSCEN